MSNYMVTNYLTVEDLKRAKEMLKKQPLPKVNPMYIDVKCTPFTQPTYSLGPCATTTCCAVPTPGPTVACNQEKDTTMYLNNSPIDIQQKQYLTERLTKEAREKQDALRHDFNLVDDEAPKSPAELIERITKGRFVVDEDTLNRDIHISELPYFFIWRDPAAKKDQAGYDAAYKAMQAAKTAATDTIIVKDAEAGLAAVTEFASKTFH